MAKKVLESTPESNSLVPQSGGELSAELSTSSSVSTSSSISSTSSPDFFSQMGDDLKEIYDASDQNVDNSEIQISRIGIVQPTSPEVTGQMEGWKGGMLYDNVLREVISYPLKQPWLKFRGIDEASLRTIDTLIFLPIFKLPTEYVRWPNKEERQNGQKAFYWKTLDVREQRVKEGIWPNRGGSFTGKGSPPVTEHLNVVGGALDQDGSIKSMPIVLSFSRTSHPTGRRFVTFCQNLKLKNLPWWGVPQYLYCDKKTNDQGTFFILRFANGPLLQQLFSQEIAKSLHEQCLKLAKELSKSDTGRAFQENLISAAAFVVEDHEGEGSGSEATEAEFASTDPAF